MSNEQISMKAAKPVSARRERTRQRLIDAAAAVTAEKGIEAATLDEIAARVGLTKGAIYDNFESKEDLILAVITARAAMPRRPDVRPGQPLRVQMREFGRSVAAFLPTAEAQANASAQLDLYALAHEGMRRRLAGFYAARVELARSVLVEVVDEAALPLPVDQFAVLLSVVTAGVIHHWLMAPGLITEDFIVAAFEALAPGGDG
jgi:AcrR family transcriptional regulator